MPALAARDDVDVVVVTEPWYADRYRAAGFGAVHVVDSVTDYSALLARCGALMRDRPFDAVLAPSERSVQPAALLRSYFGLPGTGFDVAVALSTKHVMKRKLADAGFPVADWRPARSLSEIVTAIDDLGGRVIVKPSHGVGSVGYPVFDAPCDPEEVVSRMRDTRWSGSATNPAAVVERFLDVVAEYHVDAVVVDGRTPFVAVSRYTIPHSGGRQQTAWVDYRPEVVACVRRARAPAARGGARSWHRVVHRAPRGHRDPGAAM